MKLKNKEVCILILQKIYNMNKKKNKKTKKKGGANPLFIKTIGYYTDKKLVDYRFLRNKIDRDTQKKYAKKHMVYYPIDPSSHKINDLFDISKEQKKTVLNFLKPDPAMIFTDASSNQYYKDSESIVVHDKDHIKRIDITNKLINNLNTRNFVFSKNKKNVDCANLQQSIQEYNLFISTNKAELMNGITDADEITITENELFGSPVFFYIIGKKLGFANCEMDDLDLEAVKTELDNQAGKFKNLLNTTLVNPKNSSSSSSSSSSPPPPPPPDDDKEQVDLKLKTKATLSAIKEQDIDKQAVFKSKDKTAHSKVKKGLVSPEAILAAALAILEAAERFDNAANKLKGNVSDAARNGLLAAHDKLVAAGEALHAGANYVGDEFGIAKDDFDRRSNELIRNAIEELGRAQVALREISNSVGNAAGNVAEDVRDATIEIIASVAQGLEDATVAIGAAATSIGNAVTRFNNEVVRLRDEARRLGNDALLRAIDVANDTFQTANNIRIEADRLMQEAGNQVRQAGNRVNDNINEFVHNAAEQLRDVTQQLGNVANTVRDSLGNLYIMAREALGSAVGAVGRAVDWISRTVRATANRASVAASDAMNFVSDRFRRAGGKKTLKKIKIKK